MNEIQKNNMPKKIDSKNTRGTWTSIQKKWKSINQRKNGVGAHLHQQCSEQLPLCLSWQPRRCDRSIPNVIAKQPHLL